MNYKLVKTLLLTNPDRIRGEQDISVPVTCLFSSGNSTIEVTGFSFCNSTKEIPVAMEQAISHATKLFEKQQSNPQESNSGLKIQAYEGLIKMIIGSNVQSEMKKLVTSKEQYDEMVKKVSEQKVEIVSQLCDALGIDNLDISEYSNTEALVLIAYLQKLTTVLVDK